MRARRPYVQRGKKYFVSFFSVLSPQHSSVLSLSFSYSPFAHFPSLHATLNTKVRPGNFDEKVAQEGGRDQRTVCVCVSLRPGRSGREAGEHKRERGRRRKLYCSYIGCAVMPPKNVRQLAARSCLFSFVL